jgi:hypothetical protein
MGFRTNARGLDLNRDHLKLDSAEARALVALVNAWRPHLHVDNHVSDGFDHAWVVGYATAEAPQAAPSIDAWAKANLPAVAEATSSAGHPIGPYLELLSSEEQLKGAITPPYRPRYSTGYFALRNRPSILIETTHSAGLECSPTTPGRSAAHGIARRSGARGRRRRGRAADGRAGRKGRPSGATLRFGPTATTWRGQGSQTSAHPALRMVERAVGRHRRAVTTSARGAAGLTCPGTTPPRQGAVARPRGYVVCQAGPRSGQLPRARASRPDRALLDRGGGRDHPRLIRPRP